MTVSHSFFDSGSLEREGRPAESNCVRNSPPEFHSLLLLRLGDVRHEANGIARSLAVALRVRFSELIRRAEWNMLNQGAAFARPASTAAFGEVNTHGSHGS